MIFEPVPLEDGSRDTMSQFFSEVLEHVPTMVFMKEAEELRFEYFNKAGEELLGVSRDVMIARVPEQTIQKPITPDSLRQKIRSVLDEDD